MAQNRKITFRISIPPFDQWRRSCMVFLCKNRLVLTMPFLMLRTTCRFVSNTGGWVRWHHPSFNYWIRAAKPDTKYTGICNINSSNKHSTTNGPSSELGCVVTQEQTQIFSHLLLCFSICHHHHNVVWQFIICIIRQVMWTEQKNEIDMCKHYMDSTHHRKLYVAINVWSLEQQSVTKMMNSQNYDNTCCTSQYCCTVKTEMLN